MPQFTSKTLSLGVLLVLAASAVVALLASQSYAHPTRKLTGSFYVSDRSQRPSANQLLKQPRQGIPPERLGLTKATQQLPPRAPTLEQQREEAIRAGQRDARRQPGVLRSSAPN